MSELTDLLFNYSDSEYKAFSEKLIPDTQYPIIGVKSPKIKELAKRAKNYGDEVKLFLSEKHTYYEEFLLHGYIIAQERFNLEKVLNQLNDFLPQIDNWAVCDCTVMALKVFKKDLNAVLKQVKVWLESDKPYTVRFAIVTLLSYFSDEKYCDDVLSFASKACCEHYYINMAVAWLISVMLITNFDKTICLIKSNTLPKFVHNKSIQKAVESYRISDDKKILLKELRV